MSGRFRIYKTRAAIENIQKSQVLQIFPIYYKYLYLHLTTVNIFTFCFSRLAYTKLDKQLIFP